MKLPIDRTMFWFNYPKDILKLNNKFSFEGNLLNRLLSEKYMEWVFS